MPHSYGIRARTRHMFSRNFREHGMPGISTYLKTYKVGDIVDIKANAAIHKGMPHKFYHGNQQLQEIHLVTNIKTAETSGRQLCRTEEDWGGLRTGIIYNVTKSSVGVIINKRVGNRYMEKRVNLRVEHIKHSKCRDDFLRRVNENTILAQQAKKDGVKLNLKREPVLPREARFVSQKHNAPETLQPIPYETLI
ncbi:hypothetical protein DFQ26_007793 [Actinomortierella ambigua]|nr:hypothetical protein DFQ26_007793 [Actinomortierella ambigua]